MNLRFVSIQLVDLLFLGLFFFTGCTGPIQDSLREIQSNTGQMARDTQRLSDNTDKLTEDTKTLARSSEEISKTAQGLKRDFGITNDELARLTKHAGSVERLADALVEIQKIAADLGIEAKELFRALRTPELSEKATYEEKTTAHRIPDPTG